MGKKAIQTLIIISLITGCASVNRNLYDNTSSLRGRTWYLEFDHGPYQSEVRYKADDLKLLNDLHYLLQDKYNVSVVREKDNATGFMRFLPVHFVSGGFKTVDVTFAEPNEKTIARITVKNGTRNATYKGVESFTKYAAEAIVHTLEGG